MCSRLRPYMKTHHVQTGVGHYGVFNGRKWESQIYPMVRAVIHDNEPRATRVSSSAVESHGDQISLHAMLEAEAVTKAAAAKASESSPK
jgi:poly(3-hydroxybutyrate) depolymerase